MDVTVNTKMTPQEFALIVEALGEASHALFVRANDKDVPVAERHASRQKSTEMAELQKRLT